MHIDVCVRCTASCSIFLVCFFGAVSIPDAIQSSGVQPESRPVSRLELGKGLLAASVRASSPFFVQLDLVPIVDLNPQFHYLQFAPLSSRSSQDQVGSRVCLQLWASLAAGSGQVRYSGQWRLSAVDP